MENSFESQTVQKASRTRRWLASLVDVFISLLFLPVPVLDILGIIYFLTRDALPFLDGQSIGKKIFGIRAVKQTSYESLTRNFGDVFLRSIVQALPIINFIDTIYLFGEDRLRLGDRLAKTCVIKVNS